MALLELDHLLVHKVPSISVDESPLLENQLLLYLEGDRVIPQQFADDVFCRRGFVIVPAGRQYEWS